MSDELRDRARKLFRTPFKYAGGYIWDDDGEMLADNHVGFDAPGATLRVRGWGRLGYIAKSPKEAAALQDAYGELIAEALTAHFRKRTNAVLIPEDKLKELQDERDHLTKDLAEARDLLQTAATFLSCDPSSVDAAVVREFGMLSEDTRSLLALITAFLPPKTK
jgi:hypothetical protein